MKVFHKTGGNAWILGYYYLCVNIGLSNLFASQSVTAWQLCKLKNQVLTEVSTWSLFCLVPHLMAGWQTHNCIDEIQFLGEWHSKLSWYWILHKIENHHLTAAMMAILAAGDTTPHSFTLASLLLIPKDDEIRVLQPIKKPPISLWTLKWHGTYCAIEKPHNKNIF